MKKVLLLAFLATLASANNDALLVDLTNVDIENVDETTIDIDSSGSQCSGTQISSGWNLISVAGDTSVSNLTTDGVSAIWFYKGGAWASTGDISIGDGFWVEASKSACIDNNMYTSKNYTKPTITTSWQLLGVGTKSISKSDLGASIVWTYSDKWNEVTTIDPGQGFWAKK